VAFSTGTAQDIFSNVITFPSTIAVQPLWARLLGGLLGAVGVGSILLTVVAWRRRAPASPAASVADAVASQDGP
jgi:hypothetical protein